MGGSAAERATSPPPASAVRAQSFDGDMRRVKSGPYNLTAAGLAKLIAAMDEEENTKEERLATLAELGKPKADVLTCLQLKELLSTIEITSERMIAVETCGPRVKDPENAMELVLPFFRFADDVSNPRV